MKNLGYSSILVLSMSAAVIGIACSSGDGEHTETDGHAAVHDGGAPDSAHEGVQGDPIAEPDAAMPEASWPEQDASNDCTPTPGPDLPDDDFLDSNCDGIDGDIAEAIFVAPAGSDLADGTIDAPVSSLAKGVQLAMAENKSVYLCNATYSEQLIVRDKAIRVVGGYDCDNGWKRSTERATVAPPSGAALVVESVNGPMAIERVAFRAKETYQSGESSIAGEIRAVSDLVLKHTTFEAGDAGNGKTGDPVPDSSGSALDGADGESLPSMTCHMTATSGPCASSGKGGLVMSPLSCTTGGFGGRGGNVRFGIAQQAGSAGTPGGAPGGPIGTAGNPGSPGATGTTGAAATEGIGTLADSQYVPSNCGGDGHQGTAGQAAGGGSGGASRCTGPAGDCTVSTTFYVGGGGGQGGFGGCGGPGGRGGGGGGASIGLLVVDSAVSLVGSSITTGDGGSGGSPSPGGAGEQGGKGGLGGSGTSNVSGGYPGGDGGRGGKGGAGGPGGGGPSIGILLSNSTADADATTFFVMGVGGDGGKGLAGSDGADGVTAETLEL